MISELLGIEFNIEKSKIDGKIQNIASYINKKTLMASHRQMDRNKAKGIDGVSKDEYAKNLEENIENLVKRMKSGSYKPNATRRMYSPKDGSKKMRPLGISCYEDKLIENVISKILTMIYEPKFYNESFGFRPNRNCH